MTKLGQHLMIFGYPWMTKHRVLLYMINDFITFTPRYCTYFGALLSPITPKLERIKTLPKVNHEDLTPKRILQRGTNENLDDFLSRNIKSSKKKRRLRNTSKRKLSGDNQKPKIVAISSVNILGKENLPISTTIPTLVKSVVDVVIIGADVYRATFISKRPRFLLFL